LVHPHVKFYFTDFGLGSVQSPNPGDRKLDYLTMSHRGLSAAFRSFLFLGAALVLTLLPVGVSFGAEPEGDDLKTRLDSVIDKATTEPGVVGAVVIVMKDGQTMYRRAAGYADREAKVPMRENTIFRLASLSKPIVCAAALALIDQGRLGFDDPVTKWLPEFQPKTADGRTPTITIRQLLNHTAGLSYGFLEPADGPYHRAGVSDGLDQPGLGMDEELRRIVAAGLAYEPGSKWSYSVATDVLGAVIAKVTGESLPDAVQHLVTGPLNMIDTGFSVADPTRLAAGYVDGRPAPVRMADPDVVPFAGLAGIRLSPSRVLHPASFPSGGAGMVGTAGDFVRFLEAVRTGGGPILKPATARSMMINQVGDLPVATQEPGWGFGYGGAVLRDPQAAQTPQSAGTWSWGGVYGANWFVDPERKLTMVSLTNTAIEGMVGAFSQEVRDAVYGSNP